MELSYSPTVTIAAESYRSSCDGTFLPRYAVGHLVKDVNSVETVWWKAMQGRWRVPAARSRYQNRLSFLYCIEVPLVDTKNQAITLPRWSLNSARLLSLKMLSFDGVGEVVGVGLLKRSIPGSLTYFPMLFDSSCCSTFRSVPVVSDMASSPINLFVVLQLTASSWACHPAPAGDVRLLCVVCLIRRRACCFSGRVSGRKRLLVVEARSLLQQYRNAPAKSLKTFCIGDTATW